MLFDKELISLTYKRKHKLILAVVFGVISAALTVTQAYILSRIINNVFIEKYPLGNVSFFIYLFIAVSIAKPIVLMLQSKFSTALAISIKTQLREELLEKIPKILLKNKRTGEVLNVFTSGIDRLENFFARYLPQTFLAGLIPLFILLVVFPIDYVSAIIFIFTFPIIPLFMFLIGSIAEKMNQKQWNSLRLLSSYFLDVIQGLLTIKLFNWTREALKNIEKVTEIFRVKTLNVLKIAFISSLVMELTSTVSVAIIAVTIGLRLLNGNFYFADALFILIIAPEFYLPLRQLGLYYHSALDGNSAFQTIKEIILASNFDNGEDFGSFGTSAKAASHFSQQYFIKENSINANIKTEISNLEEVKLLLEKDGITFQNVTLIYFDKKVKALDDVSFRIPPKQITAIVGKSGSGKSTIFNLILKFIEPTSGSILVGDRKLNEIDDIFLRMNISWVPQNPRLFNKSILDNFKICKPEASLEEVSYVCRRAGIDKFIELLEYGFETQIGEYTSKLSGGEQQRIAIARAYLRNSPLILIDEPTANIDPVAQQEILSIMFELCRNKTAIIIAHNINTIQKVDNVVFLRNGKVLGQGSHLYLIENCADYRNFIFSTNQND